MSYGSVRALLEWKNGNIGEVTVSLPPPPTVQVRKLIQPIYRLEERNLEVKYIDITFKRVLEGFLNGLEVPLYQEEDYNGR
jgi:hypothetical protein